MTLIRSATLALAFACLPSSAQMLARQIAAAPHGSCAILTDGGLRCWGDNLDGWLGDGTLYPRLLPTPVVGLSSGVRDVATGYSIACALLDDGSVRCWGKRLLADGNTPAAHNGVSTTPQPVPGLESGVEKISVDAKNACVVTTGGGVKCWGYNYSGQLGDGTTIDKPVPTAAYVPGLETGIRDVVTAGYFSCVLATAGAIKCWGLNENGQLGDGTKQDRLVPGYVQGLSSGVAALSRGYPNCAILDSGEVRCWGSNGGGSLGNGTTASSSTPVRVALRGRATLLSSVLGSACAALEQGGIQCWGSNNNGILGNGTKVDSSVPVDVVGISSRVRSLSVNSDHACAVLEDQSTKCWGHNFFGEIGDSTAVERLVPTNVSARLFAPSYQGLWWRSPAGSESGWGMSVAHQSDTLFVAWFTYASDSKPEWYIVSNAARTVNLQGNSFHGTLYRVTGPAFNSPSWDTSTVHAVEVGSASLDFADFDNGTVTYVVNGVAQTKAITRQVFGATLPDCAIGGERHEPLNFTDLWWGAPAGAESGWGLNLTQQGNTMFAVWYTYDSSGRPQWVTMSNGALSGTNTFTGVLYRTTGPAYSADPWDPRNVTVTPAGSATISFADSDNGTFSYTLDGVSQTKAITRQVYAAQPTVCNVQ